MNLLRKTLIAAVTAGVLSMGAFAQSASEAPTTSPIIPIKNEAAPKLILGEPLPEALARGAVIVPYRVENIRILPVLGTAAGDVSPRVGHLHVTIDDLPWHWADFSETVQTIVVVGLPPGPHKLTVGLADTNHHVFSNQTVTFNVPDTVSASH